MYLEYHATKEGELNWDRIKWKGEEEVNPNQPFIDFLKKHGGD